MSTNSQLSIAYDAATDVVTIEGVQYAAALFRELGHGLAIGSPIMLARREGGIITLFSFQLTDAGIQAAREEQQRLRSTEGVAHANQR